MDKIWFATIVQNFNKCLRNWVFAEKHDVPRSLFLLYPNDIQKIVVRSFEWKWFYVILYYETDDFFIISQYHLLPMLIQNKTNAYSKDTLIFFKTICQTRIWTIYWFIYFKSKISSLCCEKFYSTYFN